MGERLESVVRSSTGVTAAGGFRCTLGALVGDPTGSMYALGSSNHTIETSEGRLKSLFKVAVSGLDSC